MTPGHDGRFRLSYATIALPDLTPQTAVRELAGAGYRGIEWKVGDAGTAMQTRSSAPGFLSNNQCTLHLDRTDPRWVRDLCSAAGLEIVGLGPYLDINDTGQLASVMSFAAACGAPQIRLQAPRTTVGPFDYADVRTQTLAYLDAARSMTQEYGVRVVLELHHHTIASSPSSAIRLVEGFDPQWIGVIYDTGNLVWEGYEGHEVGMQVLGPYLHHVHLKNAIAAPRAENPNSWVHTWSPLDVGLVDVPSFLRILKQYEYGGWISVEDLSTTRPPRHALVHNARYLESVSADSQWDRR